MGYSFFNRQKGGHLTSTLFFTSGISSDINVLVCEVIDKTLVGFKYVYLMVPLSKYIFISSSFCVLFFF